MTLWRLEWLRLTRTKRWLILFGVYGVFGILGPLTARYLPEIIDRLGDVQVDLPELTPADGVAQYVGNAQQIGVLAVAFVAAAALAFDSNTEMSVFLRTRATVRNILTPRFVVNAAAAAGAFVFGALIAYIGTGLLLEWLDFGDFLVGLALHAWYLVFVVALIALMAGIFRNVVGVALSSIGVLIILGILTLLSPIARWLPSALVGSIDVLLRGGPFDVLPALVVTTVLIVALPAIAVARLEAREV